MSKAMVIEAYRHIRQASQVPPPIGPLDFHTGTASIDFGDLHYAPVVEHLIVYNGTSIMRVTPSVLSGVPGSVNAIFTDESGKPTLELAENVWVGSTNNWDLTVQGRRLTVRRAKGTIVLQMTLLPPGRISLDVLDMRIGTAHILVRKGTYVVGRYRPDGVIAWVRARMRLTKAMPGGRAVEFTVPLELHARHAAFGGRGVGLETEDGNVVMHSPAGAMVKSLGICLGGFTSFNLYGMSIGVHPLAAMRNAILRHPNRLDEFIGTGKLG